MTAVTDPQIARDQHNNVSIGAQNGNVALNMNIVLHSGVPCVKFFQIWTLSENEITFLWYQTPFLIITTIFDNTTALTFVWITIINNNCITEVLLL